MKKYALVFFRSQWKIKIFSIKRKDERHHEILIIIDLYIFILEIRLGI